MGDRRWAEGGRGTGVVRRAVEEIWNRGDLALADALLASSYVNHGGLIPDLVCGPEAIKVSVAMYRAAFPRFHIDVELLVDGPGTVELHWAARAPGGGGKVVRGTTRSGLVDEQPAESWTTWGRAGVLRHLGLSPADGAGPPP